MSQAKTTAGIRRAVFEGRLKQTAGGLTAKDLMVSKSTGKIVSRKASRAAKKRMKTNPKIREAFEKQQQKMIDHEIQPKSRKKTPKKRTSKKRTSKNKNKKRCSKVKCKKNGRLKNPTNERCCRKRKSKK